MKTNQVQKNIFAGWNEIKIGQCLVVKHGKPQKEIEITNGKYPILATGGIIGWTNTPLYSKPSVLIGRKGTIDRPGYMETPFWTVDTLFYTQIKDGFSAKFLFYKFQTINWKLYNEGSGLPSLSASTISSIKVNIPPLFEQNRIVAVLGVWDKAIEKLARKIELKKNIKKGLMQELLTGKQRLPGFSGGWYKTKLGNLCEIKKGQGLSKEKLSINGKYECILYGELYTKYSELIREVISRTNNNEGTPSVVGDILVPASTTTSAVDLAVATCLSEAGVLLGGDINILRSKKEYDSRFLALYLTHAKKHDLAQLAQGITIVHLYGKEFKKLEIVVPQKKEQTAIANILTAADDESRGLEKKLSLLKDQKKYLLNNLITGAIRTPENLTINSK